MTSNSDLTTTVAAIEQIPDASDDQWATWARIMNEKAPDLAAMLGVGE